MVQRAIGAPRLVGFGVVVEGRAQGGGMRALTLAAVGCRSFRWLMSEGWADRDGNGSEKFGIKFLKFWTVTVK